MVRCMFRFEKELEIGVVLFSRVEYPRTASRLAFSQRESSMLWTILELDDIRFPIRLSSRKWLALNKDGHESLK